MLSFHRRKRNPLLYRSPKGSMPWRCAKVPHKWKVLKSTKCGRKQLRKLICLLLFSFTLARNDQFGCSTLSERQPHSFPSGPSDLYFPSSVKQNKNHPYSLCKVDMMLKLQRLGDCFVNSVRPCTEKGLLYSHYWIASQAFSPSRLIPFLVPTLYFGPRENYTMD